MPDFHIIFTQHAEDMLLERGIDRSWVELTVREPDFVEPDLSRLDTIRAYRRIPERGGRMLRVAYVQSGDTLKIITAFLDRSRR